MTLLTPLTFLDDITKHIEEGWKATKKVNDGETIELRFFNQTYRNQPPGSKNWSRVTWRTNETETTFGGVGERYKTRMGIMVIEHYVPQAYSQGNALLAQISMVAESIFEAQKTPGGIWFMKVRTQELTPETPWLRANTLNEFSYTEAV